ncbi:uncharacterized protein LOC104898349 [Beta vulgaris subsp. vulgaris]|uniref:uncharacterized protein LOC104898349 n=1 Tax=Beta vulgaris subsp. vulgaris TaxID=3555 RepID=UPI002548F865|nr:uncharacterized protein LOC104898349 [Beta vulgaris subsp. vulgaris]
MADEETLVDATNDATFPPADIDGELNPGKDKDLFKVDSVSSQVAKLSFDANYIIILFDMKEPIKPRKPAKEKKQCAKKDPMQTLKTTIIVSGVILALAGGVFAITKKMKEK